VATTPRQQRPGQTGGKHCYNPLTGIDTGRFVNQNIGKRTFGGNKSVWIQRLAWLLMTATPALGTLVLMDRLGVALEQFAPATSDEIGYYLQINAFVQHGFFGGYFTISEKPAAAGFSHFGVHGPLFPVLYGTLGKLFGWHFYSGPIFNVMLLTLAIGIYCVGMQPSTGEAFLGTALLATFGPFYLVLVSVMQDPLHLAIAVIVGAGFAGMLHRKSWACSLGFRLLFLAILVYASLMRISWSMFLVPYAVQLCPRLTAKSLALAMVISAIGMVLLLYGFRFLCAPFYGLDGFLMNKFAGGEASTRIVLANALTNLEMLFEGNLANPGSFPGRIVFCEGLAFGLIMAFYALIRLRPASSCRPGPAHRRETVECCFHVFNILGLLLGILLFYYIGNDGGWRMLAVSVLVSSFVGLTSPLRWVKVLIAGIALINLGGLPWCIRSIEWANMPRFEHVQEYQGLAKKLKSWIPYREGANPWQNTILTDTYPCELLALPGGIGVSVFFRPQDVSLPIRSRYLLVAPATVRQQKWSLIPLVRFPILHNTIDFRTPDYSANLYLNPEASRSQTRPGLAR
jgi:hypothetical protein